MSQNRRSERKTNSDCNNEFEDDLDSEGQKKEYNPALEEPRSTQICQRRAGPNGFHLR